MVGLLILVGYLVGIAFSVKYFARKMIESVEREYPGLLLSEKDYRKESIDCTLFAILPAIIWPVAIFGYFIYRKLVTNKGVIETERYRRVKAERELAEMRQLAREHNLPMPEAIDSPGANGYY
jgi:hypothetical protein